MQSAVAAAKIKITYAWIANCVTGSGTGSESMALAHAIMTALIDADLSGFELARDFEKSLGFFWHASHQQIYQELHKLAEKSWLNKREVHQSGTLWLSGCTGPPKPNRPRMSW
jgi:Transcriptional regulator PadR-like family